MDIQNLLVLLYVMIVIRNAKQIIKPPQFGYRLNKKLMENVYNYRVIYTAHNKINCLIPDGYGMYYTK